MNERLLTSLTVLVAPVLIWQGRRLRKTLPRLPEPDGVRAGEQGQGQPLSVCLLGDSAAAGVGVAQQAQALSGQLVHALQADYALTWQLVATTGHTTADTLKRLTALTRQPVQVVVVSLGVNDATRLVSSEAWMRAQRSLIETLERHFGPELIVLTQVPPLGRFPALPQPLRWRLGQQAQRMNHDLRLLAAEYPQCQLVDLEQSLTPTQMPLACDGFHPSALLYTQWAEQVARLVRAKFP